MVNVLFVCLGNICRSPMAEGVFKHHLDKLGFSGKIYADSAGTGAYHVGANPDKRMCETALAYDITLDHKARQFKRQDFERFDYILPMDSKNLEHILAMAGDNAIYKSKVKLMREFDPEKGDLNVPDPYYGAMKGFDEVYVMLERATEELLKFMVREHKLQ